MSEEKKVGYVWNWGYDLGNGRTLGVTGNFAIDASVDDINREFDKIRGCLDRQQAKSALRGAEDDIERTTLQVEDAVGDLKRINGNQNGHLSAAERQAKEAAIVHVEKLQKHLEYKKTVLERIKKEAA